MDTTCATCGSDCNERDASQHPGAAELQDGIDNDCNGLVDDATAPGECQVDADCGPGQVCQSIYPPCACLDSDGDGVCENDLSSCAPTNVCVDVNPAPGCYSDADCAAGSTCNANEACLPPPGCGPGHECLTVCYGTCSPAI